MRNHDDACLCVCESTRALFFCKVVSGIQIEKRIEIQLFNSIHPHTCVNPLDHTGF